MLEYYQLYLNELETVSALYACPEGEGPFPPVLYLHSHGGDFPAGKSGLVYSALYLASPSFAEVLTETGYAVWSIDVWGFKERGDISESELFKQFSLTGKALWEMRIYDATSSIDHLETREDTDTRQLAAIGFSMGGLLSRWVIALNSRVKACINLAAQMSIEIFLLHHRPGHHRFYCYVLNLSIAYTTLVIQEKVALRPRLSLVGKNDTMCLDESVLKLRKGLDKKCQSVGSPENFSPFPLTGDHMETQEMRNIWK